MKILLLVVLVSITLGAYTYPIASNYGAAFVVGSSYNTSTCNLAVDLIYGAPAALVGVNYAGFMIIASAMSGNTVMMMGFNHSLGDSGIACTVDAAATTYTPTWHCKNLTITTAGPLGTFNFTYGSPITVANMTGNSTSTSAIL